MPKLRISIVQYLNTAPLVWGFTHGPLRGKYELSFTVPSQCAEALRTGAADIAIIPAIEYARIPDLDILPGISIASKNAVRSLLLVAKQPVSHVRSIALDRSSRSTQALTKILCAEYWKIAPEFRELPPDLSAMLEQADAALLIGDPALRLAIAIEPHATRVASAASPAVPSQQEPFAAWTVPAHHLGIAPAPQLPQLFVYDIVEQWRAMTGLPAVLAIWAARRGSSAASLATPEVVADFVASRDLGLQHLKEIAAASASELSLPAPALETYLTENIDYTLDAANLRGLSAYFTRAASLNLIPAAPALRILATPRPAPIRSC
ncbi:MAG TPA: menaquinone biosynthesis protein [Candidatus Dormibacteraeota bacterium]|nr:menaquinone biosynthesis protein [Candidatus Dormibacteraeota bacterium]